MKAKIEFSSGGADAAMLIELDEAPVVWRRMFAGLGVHGMRENVRDVPVYSLRFSPSIRSRAGEQAKGGMHFDVIRISIEGHALCVDALPGVDALRAQNGVIVIGGDGQRHCIAVGRALRVRFAVGHDAKPIYKRTLQHDLVLVPGVSVPRPAAFHGKMDDLDGFSTTPNSWMDTRPTPIGERYGQLDIGAPGGIHLNFLPYSGSSELELRRSDAMANAGVGDYFNEQGNQVASGDYIDGWWPFWKDNFQVQSFMGAKNAIPESDPEFRSPVWWNAGPSSYDDYSAGLKPYRDCAPPNLEHEGRLTMALVFAAMWGDKLAALDLEIHARHLRDVFADRIDAWLEHAEFNPGTGHPIVGGRGTGWLCYALLQSAETRYMGLRLARAIALLRMANGHTKRLPGPWGSSPDPFVIGGGITKALPLWVEGTQSMEETICDFALAAAGELDAVRLHTDRAFRTTLLENGARDYCLFERFGYIPKFVGTTYRGSIVRRVLDVTNGTDYFSSYVLCALGAFTARDPKVFIEAGLKMSSPMGIPLRDKANAIAVLSNEQGKEQTALFVAMLEQLA